MALTKTQRRTVEEIENILRVGGDDWRVVEELYETGGTSPATAAHQAGFHSDEGNRRLRVLGRAPDCHNRSCKKHDDR